MPAISLSDAARLARVNPSTITRAVKSGRLSVKILDNGRKAVDPVELERAFPSDRPVSFAANSDKQGMNELANKEMFQKVETENVFLRQQIAKLEQDKDDLRRTWEEDKRDLRTRLDRAELERSTAMRLLEDQRRPWWQRILKRAA